MTAPLLVLDTVLDDIEQTIAGFPPERGGALFGPAEGALVAGYVHDEWASTTGGSYEASLSSPAASAGDASLQAALALVEGSTNLRYRGTIHSHPGALDHPSSQDLVAFADSLRLNPWLTEFLGPIVTSGDLGPLGPHEVRVGSGKVSWFSAAPGVATRGLEVRQRAVRVLPLGRELGRVADAAGCDASPWSLVAVNGEPVLATSLSLPGGRTLTLRVWPGAHPLVPPLVTITEAGGDVRTVGVSWDLDVSAGDRLARAVGTVVRPPLGIRAGAPMPARRAEEGPCAGAGRHGTRSIGTAEVRAGLEARLSGALPRLLDRRVLLVGAGSIGSQMAEGLVRSGVERLVIIDPDLVGVENLSRTVYAAGDVGLPKVLALTRRLRSINPGAEVTIHPGLVGAISEATMSSIIGSSDLVVAATDDPSAQARLNRLSFCAGVPAVFPAVYAKGHGGEIVFTLPGVSSCYRCATAIRHSQDASVRPSSDYGQGGRLRGEVALGSDIAHVTSAATKITLALAGLGDDDSPLTSEFLLPGMAQGRERPATMVLLANVPSYSFFPEVFRGVAGQAAWQTVWLQVTGDPTCPVCGTIDNRIPPVPHRGRPRWTRQESWHAADRRTARRGPISPPQSPG